ncbi:helix-turn-helix domain-containing protein [Clostridium hydrogenum]|uniref:helix-turn-helix domain-containing protein n=1 Tax=Clostridium hydrogenum TaxID=2855764 RepID=UPI001F37DB4C|nr:helix-turn-helix domain-containing protein [Clostridium hydrogenum]
MKTYTVSDVANYLNICDVKVYELVKTNKIEPVLRIGKKIIIPEISLKAFELGIKLNSDMIDRYIFGAV